MITSKILFVVLLVIHLVRFSTAQVEFKFSTKAQKWSAAENDCRSWGGHIATPTNNADNNRLWNSIRNRPGWSYTWLGISDIASEGRWISTRTGRPVTYAPWSNGEPNGRGNENCGMMWPSNGLWNDVGCNSYRLHYVCERKRSPPPSPSRAKVTYLIKNNNTLSFKCQFSRNDLKPSTYIVSWYTSSSSSKIYSQTLNSGDVSILPERSDNPFYQLGTSVYCKVHYWFNDNPSLISSSVTSNRFYAGVEVTPKNFNIVSKGKPIEVKVKLTVPIICKTGQINCSIAVQLPSPRKDILATCPNNLVFTAATWNIVQKVTVKTKPDSKHIAAVKVSIKVTIIPQATVLRWANHTQIIVTITRISISSGGKAGRCISTGDPHLRTFDGFTYDHYRIGDYVLVKSKIRDFEVHVRTHRCYTVSCNCGVVVKEGSDVMAINFCGNFYSPFVGYLSKKEPQPGTGIERGGNGRSFTLRLASGAFVTFSTYPYGASSYSNIAVHIPSIDFRQTVGMCGIFDGNSGNDQSKPNGQNVGGRGSPVFTESWRLTQSESLFFYKETVTTTDVTATVDICLPTLTCSFEEKKVKAGHKRLGFPGLAECDKKRGKKTDPDIIITPSGGGDGSKGAVDPDDSTFVPVVPTWPTKSGITLPDATSKCKAHLDGSATFQTCRRLLGEQFITKFSATLHQCIADIQITDDTVVAFSGALQALRDICEEEVDEKPDEMKELEENLCPNECSGRGKCIKGACVCKKGFATEDCSVDLNQVPELLNVGCGHICDVRTSDCNNVVIRSTKLVPDRVQCRNGVHLSIAKVLNFAEVICPLEKSPDKFLSKHGGVPIARFDVYLSNDGKKFSTSAMPVAVYDSKCMSCDKNCGGKQVKCTLKANTCLIGGHCYTNGEVDPTDKKCGLCDPAQSTSKFVKRNGWGPWKEWSSCSKPCNGGVQKRIRVCLNSCCNGNTEETRPCNQRSCHVDVDTGFCTSVTEEECAAIATARKIPLIEIRNPNLYLFPRGCYHKQTNDKIYYNVVKSKKACSWKRICICKNVKQTV